MIKQKDDALLYYELAIELQHNKYTLRSRQGSHVFKTKEADGGDILDWTY